MAFTAVDPTSENIDRNDFIDGLTHVQESLRKIYSSASTSIITHDNVISSYKSLNEIVGEIETSISSSYKPKVYFSSSTFPGDALINSINSNSYKLIYDCDSELAESDNEHKIAEIDIDEFERLLSEVE